jgi:alpha-L-rhamnosidase
VRHVYIEPQPAGDVRAANASWDSIRGPVAVDWKVEAGSFRLSLDVPPGMTADVSVPVGAGRDVRLDSQPIRHESAIRLLREEAGRNVYLVPSGHYEFEAQR